MTIALDIGTTGLRSLRVAGGRMLARCASSVYTVMDDALPRRRMLEQLGIEYAVCEDALAVPGDAARELARLFDVPILPLLPEGRIAADDPPTRQLLAMLVEAMLPEPARAGELCGLTLPGSAAGEAPRGGETGEFLTRVVQLRGYSPRAVSPGLAIVLAELVGDGFTGVGMSFGASACHMTLAHRGMEIVRCSIPNGGRWLDEQIAGATEQYVWDPDGSRALDVDAVARWKESCDASLVTTASGEREVSLAALCRELIDALVAEAGRALEETLLLPESWPAMSVVACGGTTRLAGFVEALEASICRADWPIRVKRVRSADDADFTIARGCLIHAEIQADHPEPAEAELAFAA